MSPPDRKNLEESDIDPLEKLMKHTGCLELHYQVQVSEYKNSKFVVFNFGYFRNVLLKPKTGENVSNK